MDGGSTRTFRGNVASDSLSLSFEQCGVYMVVRSFVIFFFILLLMMLFTVHIIDF